MPMAPPPPIIFYTPNKEKTLSSYHRNRYHGVAKSMDSQSIPRSSPTSDNSNSSVGDYLTWEMAQYESSLTKLSQVRAASMDLRNSVKIA